jgi:hypothetical protein
MYFCDKCFYLFDITKSSKISKEDTRKIISKVSELLIKLEENDDITKYKADFSKEELYKNKKYQKLEETDKNKINLIFEEDTSSGAEFKCENCNYTKQITETTILYQINMEDKVDQLKNLDENELTTKDPTLPHTHDYTCKNPNCITHKNPELKDSVFLREKNSYKLNYICCVCYYNW